MEPIDKETQKIYNESTELKNMVKSTGWGYARERLMQKIVTIGDLTLLDTSADPLVLAQDIKVNQRVVKELLAWLNEIEGIVAQEQQARGVIEQYKRDVIIRY
jgi:hypothetical protein